MTAWLYFALIQLACLPFMIAGWLLLAPMAALRLWTQRPSRYYPGRVVAVWRGGWLMWPWGNEEDGVTGAAWYAQGSAGDRWHAYVWSAWRNPCANLKYVFQYEGGPYKLLTWTMLGKSWYAHAGWNSDGLPVISAGWN